MHKVLQIPIFVNKTAIDQLIDWLILYPGCSLPSFYLLLPLFLLPKPIHSPSVRLGKVYLIWVSTKYGLYQIPNFEWLFLFIHLCVWERPEEGFRSFGTRVSGVCLPPSVDAGNWFRFFERVANILKCWSHFTRSTIILLKGPS